MLTVKCTPPPSRPTPSTASQQPINGHKSPAKRAVRREWASAVRVVITINEENQPRRTCENFADFIFCTRNAFFVKIELGYRRYVVMACNSIYISDSDNSTSLNKSFTPEFYGHFLTTWRAIRAACK